MSKRLKSLPPSSDLKAPVILLTGFEPFGRHEINASWAVAESFNGTCINKHTVVAARLPNVFQTSARSLTKLLTRLTPAIVVCLGQAERRGAFSLERIAINVSDARTPDNAGTIVTDCSIVPDGPAGYFSTLPLKAAETAIANAGIISEVSNSAGTYVCNHVFYTLMHNLATRQVLSGSMGGFVHIPCLPSQVEGRKAPRMKLESSREAIGLLLQICTERNERRRKRL